MANADENSASDEASNVMPWRKGLDEGGNDGEEAAYRHAPASAEVVGERAAYEPPGNDGAYGVGGIDEAEQIGVFFLR